jgi:hypothetical protein
MPESSRAHLPIRMPWPMSIKELRNQLALLHDAVLLIVEMQWDDAKVVLTLRTANGLKRVVMNESRRLECPRDLPWGPSVCVNEIRLESVPSSSGLRMEVEMQSGDVLVIVGNALSLET